MKKINVSLDELDSLFDKLYENCEAENAFFKVMPDKGKIEVYQTTDAYSSHLIAEFNIISMHDAYDAVRTIFNKE